jgi:hypothetical protein
MQRKGLSPIPPAAAREIVTNYCVWPVEAVGPKTIIRASEIEQRYRSKHAEINLSRIPLIPPIQRSSAELA